MIEGREHQYMSDTLWSTHQQGTQLWPAGKAALPNSSNSKAQTASDVRSH